MKTPARLAMALAFCATFAADTRAAADIAATLTTSYVKVVESAGPITGLTLSGLTAFDGAGQVAFTCVSNRPYAKYTASSAIGELPAGDYVTQLSVFNCWDGTRTRSYRVQISQPVGSTDIYAYCPCFTVSQPGVNLVAYPDIRDFKDDATKIAASYTTGTGLADQLAANPVTALTISAVPYVESAGTSGIDTGYRMKPNSRLEVDFAALDGNATSARIFGADYNHVAVRTACSLYVSISSSGEYYVFGTGSAASKWNMTWMKDTSENYIALDTARHVAVIDLHGGVLRYDTAAGESISYADPAAGTYTDEATQSISLFARRDGSNVYGGMSKARIYGVRIYESDALVHDFVPCTRDGIAAFRDAMTGDFISGEQAPLAFTAGGDFENYESPYVATPANNAAYYIDTEYQASSNTCFQLDCSPIGDWGAGMSLFYGYGTKPFYGYITATGFGTQNESAWNTGVVPLASLAQGLRRTFVLDNFNSKSYSLVAGVTNGTVKTLSQSTEKCPANTITVKIASNHGGTGNFTAMKIYGCRIYESGVLVRDFVPCIRDGYPGLRDALTGLYVSFPANKKREAAAALSAGGDGLAVSADPYIEGSGPNGPYIATDYKPRSTTRAEIDFAQTAFPPSTTTYYPFGVHSANAFTFGVYAFKTQRYGYNCRDDSSQWTHGATTSPTQTLARITLVLDARNGQYIAAEAGRTNQIYTMSTARTKESDKYLFIFSSNADAAANRMPMRLYSFKIYDLNDETGEEELVRDYIPAVVDGVAGLQDILPGGLFLPPATGTFTYGGAFTPAVKATKAAASHGNPATLVASAPGAASYRWLKNGVAIGGGENGTLAAAYGGVGVVDSYQAIAIYTIDAATMESAPSDTVTVEGMPSATVIVIK